MLQVEEWFFIEISSNKAWHCILYVKMIVRMRPDKVAGSLHINEMFKRHERNDIFLKTRDTLIVRAVLVDDKKHTFSNII